MAAGILRYLGLGWGLFRVRYWLRNRFGLLESRSPVHPWLSENELDSAPELEPARPPFSPRDLAARERPQGLERARRNLAGEFLFFSSEWKQLGKFPSWNRHPETQTEYPSVHWSRVREFQGGDVKLTWEPARFASSQDLARAYLSTGDAAYPQRFWQLFEDFRENCPPNLGVQWKCGQEASLRAMSLSLAVATFWDHPESTPLRRRKFGEFLAETAERVGVNLDYAVSQDNNHATSEAIGLILGGSLLPQHPDSKAWLDRGETTLSQLLIRLFDTHGVFSQYSINYQRVCLQTVLFALPLLARAERSLSSEALERLEAASDFLDGIVDPETGCVPRFGNDDGARVLRLSECAYEDFRPLQDGLRRALGRPGLRPGPWKELADLLGFPDRAPLGTAPPPGADQETYGANLARLKTGSSRAFLRLGEDRFRPSQCDSLHLDLWLGSENLLADTGTYSYNHPPPWDDLFTAAWSHNCPHYLGVEPLERYSPFLRFPWPRVELEPWGSHARGPLWGFSARHHLYRGRGLGPIRRTLVSGGGNTWLILDQGSPEGEALLASSWHSPAGIRVQGGRGSLGSDANSPLSIQVVAPFGVELEVHRGGERADQGWYSPRYKKKSPCSRMVAKALEAGTYLAVLLSDEDAQLEARPGSICLRRGPEVIQIQVSQDPDQAPRIQPSS